MSFSFISAYYQKNTLTSILIVAFIFRMVAAIFSTGYGMHDDHFLTIEIAQSWIDGENTNEWLPGTKKNVTVASGHSLTYPSILYTLFWTFEKAGINDPAAKMFVMRVIHGLLSLLVIYWGFGIFEKLYNKKAAALGGWLLAILWFMPMLSVRNLVEMVCIPFLMFSIWLIVYNDKNKWVNYFLSGLIIGLAFSIRFQVITFIAGLGLALLIKNKFVNALLFGIGALIGILLIQGVGDMLFWGYPFAEFQGYMKYNIENAHAYPNGPWYGYSLVVAGMLIPPVSLFIIFGFFKDWKKNLIILLPVLAFFIFHSSFPNKQERFILPAFPFIIIAGVAAWSEFHDKSMFWIKNKNLYKGFLIFFLILNTILLLALSLSSSKKNRVDAMRYLAKDRTLTCFVVENSLHSGGIQMPRFYLNKQWPRQYDFVENNSLEEFKTMVSSPGACFPQYVLFMEGKNIDQRVENFKKYFPNIKYETTIEPSFLDKVMYWLNPVNANQTTFIYKINR
ncbi:MAG TPA: glycosyltransferase family 39 protein [Cytophagaceae bacterium]|jgi:hypothetical protein|nr:glycosyltransferase family 39 protein [Cytophagaceae bacterium]